jgi:hypothetical protein
MTHGWMHMGDLWLLSHALTALLELPLPSSRGAKGGFTVADAAYNRYVDSLKASHGLRQSSVIFDSIQSSQDET